VYADDYEPTEGLQVFEFAHRASLRSDILACVNSNHFEVTSWRKRVGVEPTTLAAKGRINGFEGHENHRIPFASA
jgi:hypothetical protein